jgi:signal peptidase II
MVVDIILRIFIFVTFFIFLVFVDQFFKSLVLDGFRYKSLLLNIVLVYNEGSAFGFKIMNNNSYIIFNSIILIIFSLLLIRFMKVNYGRGLFNYYYYSLVFIFSGGVGNLIDRFIYGKVVDFISLFPFLVLPIFNLADVYITIGMFLLILALLKESKLERSNFN